MRHRFPLLTMLRETAPVLAVVLAVLAVIGIARPAAAQFLPFPFFDAPQPRRSGGGGGGGGLFGGGNDAPYFAPFQQGPRKPVVREDYSKAPAPEKRAETATPPERTIAVVGDGMADWLGYGLEDAYSERPDIGIVRRSKTYSGLIRYQTKGEPADWPAAVKSVLANDNPAVVVVMLGMADRVALREIGRKPADAKPAAKSSDKPEAEQADDADTPDPASSAAPEKGSRTSGSYEFRDDKWAELYTKKIEEMIAAVKAKGAPVVWVGLPAVRGSRATSDMLYLNALYRDAAQKAGVTFVDVWDGFVDESGRFMQQGPDFEGQTRRLRSYDGVYFTKAGARKLAHYTEREINRVLASRSAPLELPTEPEKPDVDLKPGSPQSNRPLAGPIVPLTVAAVASDQLMGGPTSKPVTVNPQIARVVVKGEALTPPPGRADDGSWPRREVGREIAPKGGDMPEMASTAPVTGVTSVMVVPAQPAPPPDPQAAARKRLRLNIAPPPQQANAGGGLDFFGFGSVAPPQQQQPAQRQQQAQPAYPQQPRQVRAPSIFGQSSPFQGGFFSR